MKKINVFYATVILAVTSLVTYKLIKKNEKRCMKPVKPSNFLDNNIKVTEKNSETNKETIVEEEVYERQYILLNPTKKQEKKQE